jgi:DNA-binding LacI/PurR family transcriptional regulator
VISKRVTTRDIAQRAGVTHATVSRALRNHPEISKALCKKIQILAEEMGYSPDPMLTALAHYRQTRQVSRFQSILGIITDTQDLDAWRTAPKYNPLGYFEGINERANELGYKIEEFSPAYMKVKSDQLGKILQNRGIRGLIIAPRTKPRSFLKMNFDRFSVVSLGYSLVHPLFHRVAHNHLDAATTTMRRLRQLGYRRIEFAIQWDHDERGNHGHFAGFSVENYRAGLRDQIPWFTESRTDENFSKFRSWFKKYRPEVIVGVNMNVLGRWIQQLNLRVPDEIGFVNLNLLNPAGIYPNYDFSIAGIYEKSKIVGSTAINFLVSMLQRNEMGIPQDPQISLVNGVWIEGQTVRSQIKKS